jgi:LCP family protein required for cell wall assembly
MNLLAIGSDARSSTYLYGLADVIRFARVDFVTPRVSVLELPRDLWVEIPEISDDIDQDHEKLNQAYLYGNPGFGYYDDPSAGPGLLARTLDLNFGLRADHYVAVNMVTFTKIVDAVDGIDITLEEAVDGRTADDRSKRLAFAAGRHHLDGTQALTLARIRIDGVFERAKNQNLVLCALRRRLLQPDVVTSIPDLIRSFQDNIQTDLSLDQLGQLACLGTQLQSDNLVFASFPQELFAQSRVYDPVFKKRVFVWEADPDVLRDYASRFQAGLWPAPGADDPSSEDEGFQCPP